MLWLWKGRQEVGRTLGDLAGSIWAQQDRNCRLVDEILLLYLLPVPQHDLLLAVFPHLLADRLARAAAHDYMHASGKQSGHEFFVLSFRRCPLAVVFPVRGFRHLQNAAYPLEFVGAGIKHESLHASALEIVDRFDIALR